MADKSQKQISRRDAMKILAAAVGATALANLPGKWSPPELEMGVLPAHAQTSPAYELIVGPSDPNANFCSTPISSADILPATSSIKMRYQIVLSPGLVLNYAPTGKVYTNEFGHVSLPIELNNTSFNAGDTVTVRWSFDDPNDGDQGGLQTFTNTYTGACP